MDVYLVSRKHCSWNEDYAMVVIAESELHAERCARIESDDFRREKKDNLTIKKIKTDKEICILKANTGG